ncbi:hypothetical protein [Syntrophomonas palmitatica]|uniref:hypothetical protein n=1 Tax=Syntrophomonas palmitatica TaxID=402877 RepID=UPI0006D1CD3F|nr:hypothetical protein [Syntrophomonas palmitatica]
MRWRCKVLLIGVLFCLLLLPQAVMAADSITLDGKFSDWEGQAYVNDPAYDSFPSGDITKFAWATNDGENNLYFMIERRGWGELSDPLMSIYRVNLDLSDNGNYHNGNDRYLDIVYNPLINGLVKVYLYKGNGNLLKVYSGYWGEVTPLGGRKCEFYVSMDDLHMFPAQSLRMYVNSFHLINDRCPDYGDIQWSPIPIMPWWGLAVIFAGGLAFGIYKLRKRKTA